MNASFPPCNFEPVKYKPNSTPDDLFITYCFFNFTNLAGLARTFRHTGTKASAVFLVDNKVYNSMPDDTRNLILNCGVVIINIGEAPFKGGTNYIHSGLMYTTEFVTTNLHKLHRVIKSDGFDTFFQGDPFYEGLPENSFLLFDEMQILRKSGLNMEWVENYGIIVPSRFYNLRVKCGGLAAGKAIDFLYGVKLYLSFIVPDGVYTDQGAYHYMIITGMFRKYGVPFIEQKGKDIILVRHLAWTYHRPYERLGNFTTMYDTSKYALAVHHSYHAENVRPWCPPPPGNFPNYFNTKS